MTKSSRTRCDVAVAIAYLFGILALEAWASVFMLEGSVCLAVMYLMMALVFIRSTVELIWKV